MNLYSFLELEMLVNPFIDQIEQQKKYIKSNLEGQVESRRLCPILKRWSLDNGGMDLNLTDWESLLKDGDNPSDPIGLF